MKKILIFIIIFETGIIFGALNELKKTHNYLEQLVSLKYEVYNLNDRLVAQFEDEKEAREFGIRKKYEVVKSND